MRALASPLVLLLATAGCLDGIPGLGGGDEPGPVDYVSARDYSKWIIEMDVIEGQDAPPQALATLQLRLNEVVSKPGGIEVRKGDTLPARGSTWSQRDLLSYSAQHQDLDTGGDTVTIHLLLVDGQFEDSNALGVTFSSRSGNRVVASGPVVIFAERIDEACTALIVSPCIGGNSPTNIWTAVLVHEFGHAMGLVNNGAPMQRNHEDAEHRGHSSNCASVMYWQVETSGITNFTCRGSTAVPTTFDADDKADLCALGGKCP